MNREKILTLIDEALAARENSYCPYSGYAVGAALLTKGNTLNDGESSQDNKVDNGAKIYRGCNIENSSYGATNCAERTAIFKAVSEGCKEFEAICIVGAPKGELPRDYAFPCGICRQVMAEFCDKNFIVIVAIIVDGEPVYKEYTLSELLPEAFTASNME